MNKRHDKAEIRQQMSDGNAPVRMVVAGAGTGGHLFPGIAIAEELLQRRPGSRVLFVTTGKAIENTVLSKHDFERAQIDAAGIKGMGLWKKVQSVAVLPRGFFQSIGLLRRFSPDVVIGMGGYSSGPVIMAAWLLGIPRAIHEQNRLPGLTNRLLGRFVNRIFVSFADTRISGSRDKVRFTGNAVRAKIRHCAEKRREAGPQSREERFTVIVIGGSQGAHSINTAVMDALTYLESPQAYHFIHQTGRADEEAVRHAYARLGISAEVAPFFGDMAEKYSRSDLAVCRAGATTVAEIAAVGLPAVFVPFPFAADNHQVANAAGLVSAGAAEMIQEDALNGQVLSQRLAGYARDPVGLKKAGQAAQAAGKPDACSRIVDYMIALTGKHSRSETGGE